MKPTQQLKEQTLAELLQRTKKEVFDMLMKKGNAHALYNEWTIRIYAERYYAGNAISAKLLLSSAVSLFQSTQDGHDAQDLYKKIRNEVYTTADVGVRISKPDYRVYVRTRTDRKNEFKTKTQGLRALKRLYAKLNRDVWAVA